MSIDLPDVLILLGLIGLVVGVGLVHVPSAVVVLGMALVLLGMLLGVRRSRG